MSPAQIARHSTFSRRWLMVLIAVAWGAITADGALAQNITGKPRGQILASGDNRIAILSPAGEVLWEYATKLTHDAWKLPNGNILFGDGQAITEVSPEKKVVWQYKPEAKKGDAVYACQRLANGNTLVGENATGRILEVDPAGKVVFTLQTSPFKEGNHHNMRLARKLDNGNYLVCQSGAKVVKEYKPDGQVVREFSMSNVAFGAIRTAKETTLVASLGQITEFDKDGKKIWEFTNKNAGEVTITNMTGMHLLPDGNIVIGCYGAYGKDGKGCGLLEITREKKVVWSYANPKFAKTMMAVQMLDEKGNALPGACWR